MKCRDEFPDWFTKNQWLKKGYVVKRGHTGQELWCNVHHQKSTFYYSMKDVRKDEVKAREILAVQNKKSRDLANKKKKARQVELGLHEVWNTEYQWLQLGRKPNKDAIWKSGDELNHYYIQFGSNYSYCHISDTHLITGKEGKE